MTLKKKHFENIVGKGENAVSQHFLLFPQCFLTLLKTYFNLYSYFCRRYMVSIWTEVLRSHCLSVFFLIWRSRVRDALDSQGFSSECRWTRHLRAPLSTIGAHETHEYVSFSRYVIEIMQNVA